MPPHYPIKEIVMTLFMEHSAVMETFSEGALYHVQASGAVRS